MSSLDIPAHCCYLLILLLGMVVARGTVNALLPSSPSRWGFVDTWALFGAHVLVPLLMFWVLDYSGALNDTSLFAAVLVGIGYREIISGGVNSITMPADTARLWQPFEKWVATVTARLAVQTAARRALIEDRLQGQIAADAPRLQLLTVLALDYAGNRTELLTRLDGIEKEARPSQVPEEAFTADRKRRAARELLRELQAQKPDSYGELLRDRGIVTRGDYYVYILDRHLKVFPFVGAAIVGAGLVVGLCWFYTSESAQIRYHDSRFVKVNATNADRFRSRTFLAERLSPPAGSPLAPLARASVERLIGRLGFKDLPTGIADEILRLVVNARNPSVNAVSVPGLIGNLRTDNPDVRGRIAQALLDLHDLDYSKTPLVDGLREWRTSGKEPVLETNTRVAQWESWWRSVK